MRPVIESWLPTLNRVAGLTSRFIGIAMLVYELGVDHLHNSTAMVVGGGLAAASDILGYAAQVRHETREEREKIRAAVLEQERQGP